MHYNFTKTNSNDNFEAIDANVFTIADLLEDRGISWGAYQEDMPYSGYEGFSWVNPVFSPPPKNDYVRKHNPFGEKSAYHFLLIHSLLFCQLNTTQLPTAKIAWLCSRI